MLLFTGSTFEPFLALFPFFFLLDDFLLHFSLSILLDKKLQLDVNGIILIELNLGFDLEHILQPHEQDILRRHTSLHKVIDLNHPSALFLLVLLDNLCNLIEQLFKLKTTDINLGLVVHFVYQFVSLLFGFAVVA
jgi:hypothetical protein